MSAASLAAVPWMSGDGGSNVYVDDFRDDGDDEGKVVMTRARLQRLHQGNDSSESPQGIQQQERSER